MIEFYVNICMFIYLHVTWTVMELASCIPYALGHLRTVGVSAWDEFRENGFGGLSKTKNDRRVVHTKNINSRRRPN